MNKYIYFSILMYSAILYTAQTIDSITIFKKAAMKPLAAHLLKTTEAQNNEQFKKIIADILLDNQLESFLPKIDSWFEIFSLNDADLLCPSYISLKLDLLEAFKKTYPNNSDQKKLDFFLRKNIDENKRVLIGISNLLKKICKNKNCDQNNLDLQKLINKKLATLF